MIVLVLCYDNEISNLNVVALTFIRERLGNKDREQKTQRLLGGGNLISIALGIR